MKPQNLTFRIFLLITLGFSSTFTPYAIEPNLKIHYTFNNVTNKTVPDESGSGINGTLFNESSILTMGKFNVLSLGNGSGYLDIGSNAGNIVKSMTDYTISVYYRVDKNASLTGNGYFLWAFSVLQANNATSGPYIAYRLNTQRYAFSTGGYNNENAIQVGAEATKNTWQHILYRQSGSTGQLYIDGKLIGANTSVPQTSTTFTTSPSYNWIGRAPFSGDNYLRNTLVYDFRLYDTALTDYQISQLAEVVKDLNYEINYGSVGDFTQLTNYISQCNTFLTSVNQTDYPLNAVEEFKDAIAVAQKVVDEHIGSQYLINDYLSMLNKANTTFKSVAGINTDFTQVPEYNTVKGFKHPGALHIQEDFDRVKALLTANNPTIIAAYNKLKANAYSQSNVVTYPTETIVRGGSGENYMNAARGASMAYQNALRWKISGDKANAERAIYILNSWASVCKAITGDTNQSLASGLYGYQFANAAELMRDYDGWKPEDFRKFQRWMLTVWYPRCIDFLRRRHGTWEAGTPGHYWSNWGLCNTLAVMSIGILCDDVFIYNQGISFYKFDQIGTFTETRIPPVINDGLNEFIGNLVPDPYADVRGPYGYLGQMQESGRDQGHTLMALGLAVDISQTGWNQGDDLFSLLNNRLAAGIEYVAAYNSGVDDVPWTEYWYHDVRTLIYNSWKMYANNEGGRGAFRPYWDRIIGHYEGIKGVQLPFSHAMKELDSIDNGGGSYGQTSGGFDHLGFSTLMCYRSAITATKAPVPIIPSILYNGVTYNQSELGGLVNNYQTFPTTAIPTGSIIKFIPKLPAYIRDTGNWRWDNGATTKDLEITANTSRLYRVTYTNENGIESTQLFSIAVIADCQADELSPSIFVNGKTVNDTVITVLKGTPFTLSAWSKTDWGYYRWNNGADTPSINVSNISADRIYTLVYTNQGGRETVVNFHVNVSFILPSLSVSNGAIQETNSVVVSSGQSVELIPMVPAGKEDGMWMWNNGSTTKNLLVTNIQSTSQYTVSYTYNNETYRLDFYIYVAIPNKLFADGEYLIKNSSNGKYLTNISSTNIPLFLDKNELIPATQIWKIVKDGSRYKVSSVEDDRFLNEFGQFTTNSYLYWWHTYTLYGVENGDLYAVQNGGSSGLNYWTINSDGSLNGKGSSALTGYPFEITPAIPVTVTNVSAKSFSIYPNPVHDRILIDIEESNISKVPFSLVSLDGQVVKTHICKSGRNIITVNELLKGLYVGKLQFDRQIRIFKIIKK